MREVAGLHICVMAAILDFDKATQFSTGTFSYAQMPHMKWKSTPQPFVVIQLTRYRANTYNRSSLGGTLTRYLLGTGGAHS